MISAVNISKRFKLYTSPSDRLKEIFLGKTCHRIFDALKNVSFEVPKGETLGIIGQNGAGKSTLLKILTGVLLPDSGHVQLDGRITGLLELGTGFNPEFSGLQNIYLNGTYLGLSRGEIDKKKDDIISFSELENFIGEPVKTYSSGMVMRLAFSIAYHAEPKVFVVDEALAVGDAYFQHKCMRKIKELTDHGGSIVFVSHDTNAMKVLCDRLILLEKGRILEIGSPEAVVNTYNFLLAKKEKGQQIQYQPEEKASAAYGNQKVTIRSVSLLDAQNNDTELLMSGKPCTIRIGIEANQTVNDLTIGMGIRDRFGQDIFGTNTFHQKLPLAVRAGERLLLEYSFKEFNLGHGKYSLSVSAHSGDVHVHDCYHWIDRAKLLEVVAGDGPFFIGLVRLSPEVRALSWDAKKT